MGKRDFKDYICRPFCIFFREGQKEDMSCQGAQVVEQMVRSGLFDPSKLSHDGKHSSLWEIHDAELEANVCLYCEFRAEDCDFQAENPPPSSEPCGGYILLKLLKERGIITVSDLEALHGD